MSFSKCSIASLGCPKLPASMDVLKSFSAGNVIGGKPRHQTAKVDSPGQDDLFRFQ